MRDVCSAELTKAGSYLVHATIRQVPVAGSPQLYHVLPAAPAADRYSSHPDPYLVLQVYLCSSNFALTNRLTDSVAWYVFCALQAILRSSCVLGVIKDMHAWVHWSPGSQNSKEADRIVLYIQ